MTAYMFVRICCHFLTYHNWRQNSLIMDLLALQNAPQRCREIASICSFSYVVENIHIAFCFVLSHFVSKSSDWQIRLAALYCHLLPFVTTILSDYDHESVQNRALLRVCGLLFRFAASCRLAAHLAAREWQFVSIYCVLPPLQSAVFVIGQVTNRSIRQFRFSRGSTSVLRAYGIDEVGGLALERRSYSSRASTRHLRLKSWVLQCNCPRIAETPINSAMYIQISMTWCSDKGWAPSWIGRLQCTHSLSSSGYLLQEKKVWRSTVQ